MSRNIVFKLPVISFSQKSRHAVITPEGYPYAVVLGDADDFGLTPRLGDIKLDYTYPAVGVIHIDDCIRDGEEVIYD